MTLSKQLASLKEDTVAQQAAAHRHTVSEAEQNALLDAKVGDLEKSKDKFSNFIASIEGQSLDADAIGAANDERVQVLQRILDMTAGEPGAGELSGIVQQMQMDLSAKGELNKKKATEAAELLNTALAQVRAEMELLTQEVDAAMRGKYNHKFAKNRAEYERKIDEQILEMQEGDLVAVQELGGELEKIERTNAELAGRFSLTVNKGFVALGKFAPATLGLSEPLM